MSFIRKLLESTLFLLEISFFWYSGYFFTIDWRASFYCLMFGLLFAFVLGDLIAKRNRGLNGSS